MPAIVSPYPFVSLADFKTRLKISNATEDDLLSQILEMVSDTLELVGAGRRLRRLHRQREVFNGGERLIRVRTHPIAKIHSIRESSTRDFETSGSYTELTEGTDYVLSLTIAANRLAKVDGSADWMAIGWETTSRLDKLKSSTPAVTKRLMKSQTTIGFTQSAIPTGSLILE
jgi:hypothetical protein